MKIGKFEITDEMIDDFINQMKEEDERTDRNVNRIRKFLSKLPDSRIDKEINKFLSWEKKYEEMKYRNGIQTSSILFESFKEYCIFHGEKLDIDEDFLSSAYKWGDYVIMTFCGQGCFTRIIKNDEEIFQTT